MVIAHPAPERRWGSETRVDDDEVARERLLDAAERCFERFGLDRTTIDDVAREAKVSRSTIYRYFAGRVDLIVAAFLRESDGMFEQVRDHLSRPGPFADLVVDMLILGVQAIRGGKYLPMMFNSDAAGLTTKAVSASQEFYRRSRDTVGPFFEAAKARGEVSPDMDLDDFIEWHLRLIFSFVSLDSAIPRDEASCRRLIETFVKPALSPQPTASDTSGAKRPRRPEARRH